MRYVKTENTILAGELAPSSTVKIKLINMQSDELLTINSNVCIESTHIPGTYLWNTSNIDSSPITNLPLNVLVGSDTLYIIYKTFIGVVKFENNEESIFEVFHKYVPGICVDSIQTFELIVNNSSDCILISFILTVELGANSPAKIVFSVFTYLIYYSQS
jgi:hypothetical protein